MIAKALNPILNVSDIQESFAWFERLGWKKGWEWGEPPAFGGVCSGECEIFLCQDGQGGRGRGNIERTFGPDGDSGATRAASVMRPLPGAADLPGLLPGCVICRRR